MQIRKPGPSDHVLTAIFAGGQAAWLLMIDRLPPLLVTPLLLPALWQKLFACVFVAGLVLLACSVRPGPTVLQEVASDAVRSILFGAVLTIFFLQSMYFFERTMMLTDRAPGGWSTMLPLLPAWPVLSLFVMGLTAGNSSQDPRSPGKS